MSFASHAREISLRVAAVARGDRDVTTAAVRDAFSDAGAWITDVHLFSGVQTVLEFELPKGAGPALATALVRAGLALDDASRSALVGTSMAEEERLGTLAIVFAHGDTNLTHEVPAVPG